jgi:hypothetical protein
MIGHAPSRSERPGRIIAHYRRCFALCSSMQRILVVGRLG